jgi:hypothetical protein
MARRSRERKMTANSPLHDVDRDQAIARALVRQNTEVDTILRGCVDQNGRWIPGPLHWAWNWTQTFDEHWLDKGLDGPYHAFPRLPYMPWLFNLMLTSKILFIPKSREMMVSWATVAFAVWFCQSFPRTRVLIQSQKLEKASELVKGTEPPGYARTLWERQPYWLRDRHPLATRVQDQPADKLAWSNGSAIQGVPSGADQVRSYHPTLLIMDEAAHLDEAEGSFGAAIPVCPRIIVVSSAGPGWFASVCARD